MVQGSPKRVLCLTCNKQHNYRVAKGTGGTTSRAERDEASSSRSAKKTSAAKAGAGSSGSTTSNAKEWQQNVANRDSSDFLPYSIHKTFEVGQLVNHPKFGSGYVKEALTAQKLCVLFRDGPRTLVHGQP
jgi:hypothetical protein